MEKEKVPSRHRKKRKNFDDEEIKQIPWKNTRTEDLLKELEYLTDEEDTTNQI